MTPSVAVRTFSIPRWAEIMHAATFTEPVENTDARILELQGLVNARVVITMEMAESTVKEQVGAQTPVPFKEGGQIQIRNVP